MLFRKNVNGTLVRLPYWPFIISVFVKRHCLMT